MPRELRKIVFTVEDLHRAMLDFAGRNGVPIQRGALEKLRFDPGGEPALALSQRTQGSVLSTSMAFRLAEVMAALILFCRARAIPLPRNAQRRLERHEEGAAFVIEMG